MARCNHCKKRTHLHLNCKYCDNVYCTTCLAYEVHACTNMAEMKEHKRETLMTKLEAEKVVGQKVIKI